MEEEEVIVASHEWGKCDRPTVPNEILGSQPMKNFFGRS